MTELIKRNDEALAGAVTIINSLITSGYIKGEDILKVIDKRYELLKRITNQHILYQVRNKKYVL